MKLLKIFLLVLVLSPLSVLSQIEIAPSAGYMFGGRLNYYEGELKIYDNANYGVSFIVPDVSFDTDLEINYTRMDTRAKFRATPQSGYDDANFDMSVNYIQVGALKALNANDEKLQPFGSFSLGATIFSPKADVDDTWQFSITLGMGTKYWITDRVGIIVRGRLMMPMVFGGVGGYYGIGSGGSGGGLSVNTYTTILQGDFSGGLIFSLGK